MQDEAIYVGLQCEGEPWTTALVLSKADALAALHISKTSMTPARTALPSIQGFVEHQSGVLSVMYKKYGIEHIISLPCIAAYKVLHKAIFEG